MARPIRVHIGEVTATSTAPYYSSTCSAVPCPIKSIDNNISHVGVPYGCICNVSDGFKEGSVTATSLKPFYASSCYKNVTEVLTKLAATVTSNLTGTYTMESISCLETNGGF